MHDLLIAPGEAEVVELLGRADEVDGLVGGDHVVTPGADGDLGAVHTDDRHRRQIAEALPQGGVALGAHRGDDEAGAVDVDFVGGLLQAGFDHRGRREGRDIEDAPGAGHAGDRTTHGRVRQVDDDAHVRTQLVDDQRGFQGVQLVVLDADDRVGTVDARLPQGLWAAGTAGQAGHAPLQDETGGERVRPVVDDHDLHSGQMQLLDRAQADAVQPADDDVPTQQAQVVAHLPDGAPSTASARNRPVTTAISGEPTGAAVRRRRARLCPWWLRTITG